MIIPFTVAIVCILSHTYDLDPVLVFFGVSETVRHRSYGDADSADAVPDNQDPRALRPQAAHGSRRLDHLPLDARHRAARDSLHVRARPSPVTSHAPIDRSRSRDRSDRDRDRDHDRHHRHHRPESHHRQEKDKKKSSSAANTFIGAGGGALIGDMIFPGLGTLGGAVLGGLGGHKVR